MKKLLATISSKDLNIRDLTETIQTLQPDAPESRILTELQSTQRERQQVNEQMATVLSPSTSNASIASKETTGNYDLSPTSMLAQRFTQNVLDTIVQVWR